MQISRRSSIAYASAATVCAALPLPTIASPRAPRVAPNGAQQIQHLVIHEDESGGLAYLADLSIPASDTTWRAHGRLDETAFHTAQESYRRRGYGLRRVSAFQTRRGLRYAAIWQFGYGAPAQIRLGMTLAEFRAAAELAGRQGLAMTHLDASATAQGARFAAIWKKSDGPAQDVRAGLTGTQYEQQCATLAAQGFAPSQIAGYAQDGEARFAVVFVRDGVQRQAVHAIAAEDFRLRSRAMVAQGYSLRDASGFVAGGQPYYAGVWDKA